VVSTPRRCEPPVAAVPAAGDYLRYQLTSSGVSTLAVPGDADRRFTADGLEHNEKGTPSARQSDHQQQLEKRQHKLTVFDYGEDWAAISGSGSVALVSFGSSAAAVTEASAVLSDRGVDTRVISLRLLAPLQKAALADALAGCEWLIVVEQNHGGQLFRYLKGEMDFPQKVRSYAMAGPAPLSSENIVQRVLEVIGE
jgi:2-oxoglutarate ferredoxin oxidoreductase subunit alpha